MRSRVDRALARLLLKFYPTSVREARAAEIEQLYRHCVGVESRRRGPVVARVLAMADALRGGLALRRREESMRRDPLLRSLAQDVRFAVRGFRRAPLFFGGILLVLALGIGANGAIFSLVKAVLLDPLPYREPDRIVMVWEATRVPELRRGGTTADAIRIWRSRGENLFEDLATLQVSYESPSAAFDIVFADRSERLRGAFATPNFFSVLGVEAAHGRVFSPADEAAGHTNLVVLSHAFWQRTFGGRPDAIGNTIVLTSGRSTARVGRPHTVIGVLPASFRFKFPDDMDVWATYPESQLRANSGSSIDFTGAVARLAPGVSVEAAAARLADAPISRAVESGREFTLVEPINSWVAGETRPSLLLLSGVAGLLLVSACATVASALLVRLVERQRELALRASLGAGRGRLVRQLLAEGVVLAAAGTCAGLILAAALLPVFRSLVPSVVPRADEMSVDPGMIGFGAVIAGLVTILAALVPALQGSRADVTAALGHASRSASADRQTRRWRTGLIAGQTAVTIALVVAATSLVMSFWRLARVDLGFDGGNVLALEMRVLDGRSVDRAYLERFQTELLARARAIPGVQQAGVTTAVPFRGVDFRSRFDAAGCHQLPSERTPDCQERSVSARRRTVDPTYFEIMGIRPARGRLFESTDVAGSPTVAVVSESFARAMFGEENPIGQTFDYDEDARIVGVVPDVRYASPDREPDRAVYFAQAQNRSALVCLLVRAEPGATGLGDALRQAVHATDPTVPAMNLTTIDQIISDTVADRRFYTATTSAFAALALLLTATGLIVVVGRAVAERRREMAIRSALGARTGQLVSLVARQGLVPVLAGTAGGLALAWMGTTMLDQFLYQVSAREPLVYAITGALTAVVAGLACLLPARRLGRLQPAEVLRGE